MRTLTQPPRSAARMARYLFAPPATPMRRGACRRSAGVMLTTVAVDALPRDASGKVVKGELRKMCPAGASRSASGG